MPLYIKDDTVDALAIRFQHASGARNKTAAVRKALEQGIAALEQQVPLIDQFKALQSEADQIGDVDPAFDQKAHADDLWESM